MMYISKEVRAEFERLRADDDHLSNLRSLRVIGDWVADMTNFVTTEARNAGYSLQLIGEAQNRPRQAVHRKITSSRRLAGLTDPQFDGKSVSTMRYWLDWLADPVNARALKRKGRDAEAERAQIMAELEARDDKGLLRKPPGGLKAMRNDG